MTSAGYVLQIVCDTLITVNLHETYHIHTQKQVMVWNNFRGNYSVR